MPELSESQKSTIRADIAGKSGKVRTGCPACEGSGSQEKTLEVRTEDGFFHCFRCKLSGYLDRPGHDPASRPPLPLPEKPDRTPEEKAAWIWAHSEALPENFTDHPYLQKKGVPVLGGVRRYKGALLVPLRAPGSDHIQALQFIAPAGEKRFLKGCSKKGAAFQVGGIEAAPRVCIAEGLATGLSVYQSTGFPVFCAMDSGNLRPAGEAVRLLLPGMEIVFAADNDRAKPPEAAGFDEGFRCAVDAARAVGGKIAMPETAGQDFNDLFCAAGPEAVKTAIDAAADPPGHEQTGKPDQKTKKKKLQTFGPDSRPEIQIIAGKIDQAIDAAEKALIDSGEEIFVLGSDYLVRPIKQAPGKNYGGDRPEGQTVWAPVTVSFLVYLLTQKINFQKFDQRVEGWIPCNCPKNLAEGLISKIGLWSFSVAVGLIHCPGIRWDGSLMVKPGYDPQTGIFAAPNGHFPPVKENPTKEDAEAALKRLREAIQTFPFDGPVSESVALAGMITAVIRPMLNLSPLFLISASAPGSGKSMLVDGFCILATGFPAAVSGGDESPEESKAHLDSLLLQGSNFIALDNLEQTLKGVRLTQLLSSERVSVRVKGFSKEIPVAHSAMVFATGNNASVGGDLPRRTLYCYIDAKAERPEAREFDESFQSFCLRNRGELVNAALTIMRAYVVAGRPKQKIPALGGFDMFSAWVRSPLVWLEMEDPLKSQEAIREADVSLSNLTSVFEAWREAFGDRPQTTKAGCRAALDKKSAGDDSLYDALENVCFDNKTGGLNTKRLGAYFRRYRKRIINGLQLVAAGTEQRAALWAVVDRTATDGLSEDQTSPDESPRPDQVPAPGFPGHALQDTPAPSPAYSGQRSLEI